MQVAGKRGRSVYYLKKLVPYVLDLFDGEIYGDVTIYHRNLGRKNLKGLYFLDSRKIFINSTAPSFLEKIESLLHECVHANQHFRGDLETCDGDFIYQNVCYSAEYVSSYYRKIPFEVEAFEKQRELFIKLMHNVAKKNMNLAREIQQFERETMHF